MSDFSSKMEALYRQMQEAYDSVARHYGFSCMGCTDNCCTQRFYHYTLAEYKYLHEGVRAMMKEDPELVRQIMLKAKEVVAQYTEEIKAGAITPQMCPINFDGLCRLYAHRPMVCRMHGLPHRFKRPDGREERGGGCAVFEHANKTDWSINRTKLYSDLARIEKDLRQRTRFSGQYKKTTAELLMDMWASDPEIQTLMGGAAPAAL